MEVYFALNRMNGKAYVGWTQRTARVRFQEHCSNAHNGSPFYFHRAIRKHGADAFDVITVYKGDDAEEMKQVEKNYIAGMRTNQRRFGYNLTDGGDGLVGHVVTEETRAKHAEAARRTKNRAGTTTSPEARLNMSVANKAKITDEYRQQVSDFVKRNPPRKGTSTTPEALERIRAARRKWSNSAEDCRRSGIIGGHVRYHVNKGIVKEGCELCMSK